MSANVRISNRGWFDQAADRKRCPAQVETEAVVILEQFGHRADRATLDDLNAISHFDGVGFKCPSSSVMRLSGFWDC